MTNRKVSNHIIYFDVSIDVTRGTSVGRVYLDYFALLQSAGIVTLLPRPVHNSCSNESGGENYQSAVFSRFSEALSYLLQFEGRARLFA